MTEHVNRVDTLEVIVRKNQLERMLPILLQALEQIADNDPGTWGRIATDALHEADRELRQ